MTSSACTSPLDIQVTGLHCLESFLSGPARPLGREAARSAPPALRTLCPVWQRRLVFVRVPFSSLQVSLAGLSPPPATRGTFCLAGSTSPPRLCQVDEFLNASMQLWEGGRVRERVGAALVGVVWCMVRYGTGYGMGYGMGYRTVRYDSIPFNLYNFTAKQLLVCVKRKHSQKV